MGDRCCQLSFQNLQMVRISKTLTVAYNAPYSLFCIPLALSNLPVFLIYLLPLCNSTPLHHAGLLGVPCTPTILIHLQDFYTASSRKGLSLISICKVFLQPHLSPLPYFSILKILTAWCIFTHLIATLLHIKLHQVRSILSIVFCCICREQNHSWNLVGAQ